jgi:arylsulfatase A-like enzyme/tetratricopeptide (TPR) repeat protein
VLIAEQESTSGRRTRGEHRGRVSAPLAAALVATFGMLHGCGGGLLPGDDRANVLLITLDTTRADFVGVYGQQPVRTPALDRLAAEGVLFTNAATSVPLTLPAHTSLMTGTWPLDHGVRDNVNFLVRPEERTLAEALQEGGFTTSAVIGAYVLHHGWGLDQGFDDYDDRFEGWSERSFKGPTLERKATEVARRAIEWWDGHPDGRFFVWLHFYDPHFPYEPPDEFADQYPDQPYAGEIAYTDSELGRVFDYLKQRGLYDTTLIVVVGDHGEGLQQHREPDHGIFLYESTMRVPLIIRAPGGRLRGRVEELSRQIDVMPTILEFLGLPVPDSVRGESLLPLMAGRAPSGERFAYGETFYSRFHYGWSELQSLRDSRYKYVRAPRSELYDLRDDPGETFDLVDVHPGIAEDLGSRLEALIADAGVDAGAPMEQQIDPETLDRLQSLGYVGSVVTVTGDELPDPKDRAESLALFSRVGHRGPRELRQGNYEQAIRMVDEALDIEPNYLDGYQIKAEALRKLRRFDEAIEVLERALKLNPENLTTLHELAECHRAQQEFQTALDLAERIRALSPGYAGAYYTVADVYSETGRHDEAIRELEALLERQPDNAFARYEIGRIHLKHSQFGEAEREIHNALAMKPKLLGAHFNLALIAEQRGDREGALREYREEIDVFPGNFEAWVNLGILQLQNGELDDASQAFERVVELKPEMSVGYLMLARTYQLQGRAADESLRLARKAVELDPASTPARQLLQQLEQ